MLHSARCARSVPQKYRDGTAVMFHGKALKYLKAEVMEEFSKDEGGKCMIVIATSALGMGVNIKNIRHIIHVGLLSDVEAYIQDIGRAGRNGKPSEANVFYLPCDMSHCVDEDLAKIIKYKDGQCRRAALLKCFNEVPDPKKSIELHECCDVSKRFCMCVKCVSIVVPEVADSFEPLEKVRTAYEKERDRQFWSVLCS